MTPSRLQFRLDATAPDSRARAATFRTLHNEVLTPLFMPVGTQATVKAQLPQSLEEGGSQILLANTYHLLLRPGTEVFERMGGIHGLMRWPKSVLTDSGGYQIFSLPHSRSMSEDGAVFQSYVDGKAILLSPEVSIATQRSICSDIMMVLDQCIPSTASEKVARAAVEITQRWAVRSLEARGDSPQSMFAIVQGALFPALRKQSAEGLLSLPFDGYAIGGLAVGEGKSEREDTCAVTAEMLPGDRPRYLMGVGTPLDLLEAVHRGVDMFDCIIPTQVAKRGTVFTARGLLQMRRSVYKFSDVPISADCACPTCQKYPRAYLHHLTKTQEPLGWQLMGQHNLWFYHQLMREIRASILEGRFLDYYNDRRRTLDVEDEEFPNCPSPPSKVKPSRALTLGVYEMQVAPEGHGSIRQTTSGEIMHSRTPPIEEARDVYVEQSDLASRLRSGPVVLWDVGLGAAANAMAAIQCYEQIAAQGGHPEMHIVSFENDLDSLRLALRHKKRFRYLRHGGPDAILARGKWHSRQYPGLRWTLLSGDFFEQMEHAPALPDLIYYDMFSTRSEPRNWDLEAFQKLFQHCQHRHVELFTYSMSTAGRVAMLAEGFWVATGCRAGVKSETTIALTPSAAAAGRHPLLGKAWLGRWQRSHAKFPEGLAPSAEEAFAEKILQHPQFS